MGRGGGGLSGGRVQEDIESGNWREVHYQVAKDLPPSANWFLVEDLVQRLASAGQLDDDPFEALRAALHHAISCSRGSVARAPLPSSWRRVHHGCGLPIPPRYDG